MHFFQPGIHGRWARALAFCLLWLSAPWICLAEKPLLPPTVPAASNQPQADGSQETGGEETPGQVVERLAAFHSYMTDNVEILSWKIDTFFGASRVYEEYEGNYIQLRGSSIYAREGGLDFDGKLRAKFDLPNLSERANLVFESEDEDESDSSSVTTGAGNSLAETFANKDLNTSLQFILQEKAQWDVRLQPGLKVRIPLDPFVRLRFRYRKPTPFDWLGRLTLTPGWYNSRGWETRVRLDLERDTGGESLFRASSSMGWQLDDARRLFFGERLFYAHPLNDRSQMAYEVGMVFELNGELRDINYFSSIRYRRNIHEGWVFVELNPQLEFARDYGFHANPSLVFTLEMLFGNQP